MDEAEKYAEKPDLATPELNPPADGRSLRRAVRLPFLLWRWILSGEHRTGQEDILALYIGFYRIGPGYADYANEKITSDDWTVPTTGNLAITQDVELSDKIRRYPAFLESRGIRLIGSCRSVGFSGTRPDDPSGVTIIETYDDLGAIANYYTPYVAYSFYRYNAVARPS